MPRVHLFEFEDQRWFPAFLRNYMTDYLQFIQNKTKLYKSIVPLMKSWISEQAKPEILDLASGGGGPWPSLIPAIREDITDFKVVLSDYYPNIKAFEQLKRANPEHVAYFSESISALEVPNGLPDFRTQFLSLHHFRPNEARQILQNAVDSKASIAIFEAQQPTLPFFIQFFFSPLFVLLLSPLIRPFSIGRLVFTYLIPLVPLFVWWDGLVSVVRTYSLDAMRNMTEELRDTAAYEWQIAEAREGASRIFYLYGRPLV